MKCLAWTLLVSSGGFFKVDMRQGMGYLPFVQEVEHISEFPSQGVCKLDVYLQFLPLAG